MGEFQEGEGCNVLLPLPPLGGVLCYFLSTGTESRLVSNDKICLFFVIPQRIGEEKEPRAKPLEPASNSALLRRVVGISYAQT